MSIGVLLQEEKNNTNKPNIQQTVSKTTTIDLNADPVLCTLVNNTVFHCWWLHASAPKLTQHVTREPMTHFGKLRDSLQRTDIALLAISLNGVPPPLPASTNIKSKSMFHAFSYLFSKG